MATWNCFLYHNLTRARSDSAKLSLGHDVDFLLFEKQIANLKASYDVITPSEAVYNLNSGKKGKFATIWFDDAFKSVSTIAFPILSSFNLPAAVSVCSSMYNRETVFWRYKLQALIKLGYEKELVGFLNKEIGRKFWKRTTLKNDSITFFDFQFIQGLDSFIKFKGLNEFISSMHDDFCNKQEIEELQNKGWEITNHSSMHYPITESSAFNLIEDEFSSNSSQIYEDFKIASPFLVAPFSREGKMDERVRDFAAGLVKKNQYLVLVNEKKNTLNNLKKGLIYRHTARVL
ncbi:polysaccharide deacetylase family protein [Pseudoalteromonas sp. SSDWG2]|uniref:polysaccharide deacetylase family protein n=1 Tax=Pseudoalteromonas sp. SSDWG2 TaxID=3139391 RepID=UPI003BAA04B4